MENPVKTARLSYQTQSCLISLQNCLRIDILSHISFKKYTFVSLVYSWFSSTFSYCSLFINQIFRNNWSGNCSKNIKPTYLSVLKQVVPSFLELCFLINKAIATLQDFRCLARLLKLKLLEIIGELRKFWYLSQNLTDSTKLGKFQSNLTKWHIAKSSSSTYCSNTY